MRSWHISIPVQVLDDNNCWVPGPGDGTPYAIGQRINLLVKADSADEALAKIGTKISVELEVSRLEGK